jgi:transposase
MARTKFSLETRVAVIKHYLSGNGGGMRRTANLFGMHKSTVSQWVAAYQQHGPVGAKLRFDDI